MLRNGKKAFFLVLFFMVFIQGQVFSAQITGYRLSFTFESGHFYYQGAAYVTLPSRFFLQGAGSWRLTFYDSEQNIVFSKYIKDPRLLWEDDILPDGSLAGSLKIRQEASFSVCIPELEDLEDIVRVVLSRNQNEEEGVLSLDEKIKTWAIVGEAWIDLDRNPFVRKQGSDPRILSVEKIIDNGPDENRINIVFIPKNYALDEMPLYQEHVRDILDYPSSTIVKNLFEPSPLREFQKCFNFYRADIKDFDVYKDTKPTGQLWSKDAVDNFFKDYFLIAPDIYCELDRNLSVMGSCGPSWFISTKSMHPYTVIHELGHSVIADLGDEYVYFPDRTYPGSDDPDRANWTIYTEREKVKWKYWILETTPVPTPPTSLYNNIIGVFRGANYINLYRPSLRSCIMGAGPYRFCEVCREAFTIKLIEDNIEIFTSVKSSFYTPPDGGLYIKYAIELDESLIALTNGVHVQWRNENTPLPQFDDLKVILVPSTYFTDQPKEISVKIVGIIRGFFKGAEDFIRKDVEPGMHYTFPKPPSKGRH